MPKKNNQKQGYQQSVKTNVKQTRPVMENQKEAKKNKRKK